MRPVAVRGYQNFLTPLVMNRLPKDFDVFPATGTDNERGLTLEKHVKLQIYYYPSGRVFYNRKYIRYGDDFF